MLQLSDVDAAEETERAQPPAALEQIAQTQRLPRPEQHFAPDDLLLRTLVPHDEDVIDDCLRPFGHRELEIHARAVLGERRSDLNVG